MQHSAADGINGRQGAALTVRDVRVLQSADDGIEVTETSTVRFLGTCEIRGSGEDGIAITHGSSALFSAERVRNGRECSCGDLCHWDIDRRVRHWHGTHHPEHLRDSHPETPSLTLGRNMPTILAEQNTLDGILVADVRPPARWRDDQRHPE